MRAWIPALALIAIAAGCGAKNEAAQTGTNAAADQAVLANNPASANDGARVYATNCSSCHQADGRGVPGAFPPLAGNPVVTGDPQRLIGIVKLGMSGKISVAGERYDGTMPHWGQLISDDEIAAVVSFIRTSWHNRAGTVTLADVQAISK